MMLMPLDEIDLVPELSGQVGSNRVDDRPNLLGAKNDIEAAASFLREYVDCPRTHVSYRKEIERLILWAVIERKKSLSSLTRDDFSAYSNFLEDPQPRERWCGPKGAERYSPMWRPFVGPVSTSARRTSIIIINVFMNYLVDAQYLRGNPLGLMKRRNKVKSRSSIRRSVMQRCLTEEEWAAVVGVLKDLSWEEDGPRLKFIVALMHFLSLRIGEVASHSMGDFVRERDGRWMFYVTGKGDKDGAIPVNSAMLESLKEYRRRYFLSEFPGVNEATPLVGEKRDGQKRVGDKCISTLLKRLFWMASKKLRDPYSAQHLQKASAHWLRHTSLTRQSNVGVPMVHLKANARHENLNTTMIYLHSEDRERSDSLERLGW